MFKRQMQVRGIPAKYLLCLAVAGALILAGSARAAAIYTTDSTCSGVNVNHFDHKDAVYLDGGPKNDNQAAALSDGSYYVKVTSPNGDLLGASFPATVQVAGGKFAQCYQLSAIVMKASDGSPGYDDTANPGGVYKVWVSMNSEFPESDSKTDNFKIRSSQISQPASLDVVKFYDANANGINDDNQLITGWKINIYDGVDSTCYTPASLLLDPDTYTVSEFAPLETSWMPTTPTSVEVTLSAGAHPVIEFGNLCLGPGGGLTLGFWSNKNGQSLFGPDDLNMLRALNLRNADGSNFNPANYLAFRTWILNANAVNMANMLSAQLAAMALNVFNGKVGPAALIYAPGTGSANTLGFATVNAIMAEANVSLAANPLTITAGPERSAQEALKNALDNANNNKNFVQPTPCPFSFAP